jgi:hypothetical protein
MIRSTDKLQGSELCSSYILLLQQDADISKREKSLCEDSEALGDIC